MSKRAADKIMEGLREALAVARGERKPARVSQFVECRECLNFVRLADRCSECNARLYGEVRPKGEENT